MTNTAIVQKYYEHLSKQEFDEAIALYHEKVEFNNEALGEFHGIEVVKLMYMMVDRGLYISKVEFKDITAFGDIVSVVSNMEISDMNDPDKKVKRNSVANFTIKDGKIISQLESFDISNWALQVFGWKGHIIGKTLIGKKLFQKKIRDEVNKYELK